MPKQGVVSMFNFGRCFGLIEGVVAALGYAYTIVLPVIWQRAIMGKVKPGETKPASIAMAKQIFPNVPLFANPRSQKEHDGLADALLIAEYGRRKLHGPIG